MDEYFRCSRCGNDDPKKLGILNGKYYCRACIAFNGQNVVKKVNVTKESNYLLKYPLSDSQNKISKQVVDNYKKGIDTLIHAVCGAGKTELVYDVISYCLSKGGKVGFAIPRKDVVIELFDRIKSTFINNNVCCVYGGKTDKLDGDIICLTTHQLYRYNNFFDLLIIDEIDAFPYADNDVLEQFAFNSVNGNLVMLSATPSQKTISFFSNKNRSILTLNKRFHNFPLPVPKILVRISFLKYFSLVRLLLHYQKQNKRVFVFTPTIKICETVFNFCYEFVKYGNFVHSQKSDREEVILDFKNNKYDYLITTSVLERGVTVKDLQVIVFFADHKLYTSSMLIQISGRVGRKIDAPIGDVIFLVDKQNEQIEKCISQIKLSNQDM